MRSGILSSVSVIILVLSAPSIALAGFEFVAPQASSSNSAAVPVMNDSATMAPSAPAVPNPPIRSDNLPPPPGAVQRQISERSETPIGRIAVPLTPVVRDSDALSIVSRPAARPSSPSAMPMAITRPIATTPDQVPSGYSREDSTQVEGFGRSVPLSIALQQILPNNVRPSYGSGVSPNTKISWSGGKPWKQVIADMARNNDLTATISGNTVTIANPSAMESVVASSSSIGSASTSMLADDYQDDDNTVLGIPLKRLSPPKPRRIPAPAPVAPMRAMPIDEVIYDGNAPAAASTTTTTTVTETASSSSSRQPIASITDAPVSPAETAPRSTSGFDSMLDDGDGVPTRAQKSITTADNKPVDILEKISVASPSSAPKMPAAMPKPVDSVPMPPIPMPASSSGVTTGPMNITKQIDNTPVMGSDLPMPAAMPSPIASSTSMETPISTSKAGLNNIQEWTAHKGETLRQTLTAWAEQAGASLVWSSEYDYPLQTDVRIQANFADTVRTLLAGFSKAQPRPVGRLFKNDKVGAQPVLIVETQRLTN